MAAIKIERKSEFNNKMRDFKIYLDGVQVGAIADGQTIELQTTAGYHAVVAKIDWCSSREITFTLRENDTKHLYVSGFRTNYWFLLNLLVPFYYLTIGRKDYLVLEALN